MKYEATITSKILLTHLASVVLSCTGQSADWESKCGFSVMGTLIF